MNKFAKQIWLSCKIGGFSSNTLYVECIGGDSSANQIEHFCKAPWALWCKTVGDSCKMALLQILWGSCTRTCTLLQNIRDCLAKQQWHFWKIAGIQFSLWTFQRYSLGAPTKKLRLLLRGELCRTVGTKGFPEPVFVNVYGAQESIPRYRFRQPM